MRPRTALRERLTSAMLRAWEGPGGWSILLLPLSGLYAAVTATRRWLYQIGVSRQTQLAVPVIVVGNIIVGGAGKTPAVLAIVELLRRRGERPGIVSRGYGRAGAGVLAVEPAADAAEVGDEPLLLRRRAGVPVFVGKDRAEAAQALLRAHPEVTVLVADDGLQHLALGREIEVVVFDERGEGNGRLLPAGPLREPMRMTAETRLVLYNAERPSTRWPGFASTRTLAGAVDLAGWWRGEAPSLTVLGALRGRAVLAVAGVARPSRFFALLASAGIVARTLPLPDHASFTTLPWADGDDVIVTEKDAVKLHPERCRGARLWVAALDFVPEPAFADALWQALVSARPTASN